MNNFDSEGGNSYRLKINDRNYEDAASMLLNENSEEELYVCVYNFNNSWMCTSTSFGKALGDSLYPKKADHPSYYSAESTFRNLLYSKKDEVNSDVAEEIVTESTDNLYAANVEDASPENVEDMVENKVE